jgi:hypothetical protein
MKEGADTLKGGPELGPYITRLLQWEWVKAVQGL